MTLLASFGVGVLLGMRFRVLVLIPAIACAVLIQVALAVVSGQHSFGSVIPPAAATVAILQIGYWAGLAGRYLSACFRLSRTRDVSLPGSRPASHRAN
jgi:putative Ca2+/H+ antiporter (TMEM165/GDT1 family)